MREKVKVVFVGSPHQFADKNGGTGLWIWAGKIQGESVYVLLEVDVG
jgi:hypothetical protein